MSFDAIVVGAGIVGTACAMELSAAGLKVAICDEGDFAGGGATAAGMGHIAVMDDSEPQFALTAYSQKLWRDISGQIPRQAEYLSCGSLWVAEDEEELAEVQRKYRFYSERGLPVEILDPKQVREAEPKLRNGMAGALLMSADGVCYPPCAARYFADHVMNAGGKVFFGKRVIRVANGEVKTADGASFSSKIVILAAGVSSVRLLPELPIKPRKGHLLITDRYPGFLHHQLIELGYLKSAHSSSEDSVAFNAQPRATGQILIGSSRQFGTEDPAVEHHMIRNMLSRAIAYMPSLENLSAIRVWTGFRAATPDKLPLIGLCPNFDSVYLATGHEGLGISTSLATARLLADEILNRPSEISRLPYRPDRTFAHHAC